MEKDPSRAAPPASSAVPEATAPCVECGRIFPVRDMLAYGQYHVCADDKPVFQQKLAEGVFNPGKLRYAGFWIRFAAVLIDSVINYLVIIPVTLLAVAEGTSAAAAISSGLSMALSTLFGIAYYVFFTGRFGATPGKMALKLRTVRANGAAVGYGLAFGRYLAYLLSGLTLGIGYVMAGFDREKRSLHDRICGTRVIRV